MNLLLELLKNKDARYVLIIACLCGSTYFYRTQHKLAQAALAASPKLEERKNVKEERAEVRTVKKYKDGKLDEVITIKGPVVKTTESEKKVDPIVVPVRTDRVLAGPMLSNYGLGLSLGYSFNNRADLVAFANKDFTFYGGNLVFRF